MSKLPAPSRVVARVSQTLRPIFDQFLAIQEGQRCVLGKAIAAGDVATAHRLAHSLKGAAATYELPDAAAIACGIETAVLQGDLTLAASRLETLAAHFDALDVVFIEASSLPVD